MSTKTALPTYQQVSLRLHLIYAGPLVVLDSPKTPTKKGLGRFVAEWAREYLYYGVKTAEWWITWQACTTASRFMLDNFHVRLPRDTFREERARVRYQIEEYKRLDRAAFHADPDARKALAWASK